MLFKASGPQKLLAVQHLQHPSDCGIVLNEAKR